MLPKPSAAASGARPAAAMPAGGSGYKIKKIKPTPRSAGGAGSSSSSVPPPTMPLTRKRSRDLDGPPPLESDGPPVNPEDMEEVD